MTDQQANNRRIHELIGRGEWNEYNHSDHKHPDAVKGWRNVQPPSPDYYNDINAAREALAFAVEQKAIELGSRENAELSLGMAIGKQLGIGSIEPCWEDVLQAALAPPEVLCDAFLGVMTEGE